MSASPETFEKIWVPFSNSTQILVNTPNGFSVFCRFRPHTLAPIPGGTSNRCLWIKQDDALNGAMVLIGDDGSVYFNVKKGGTRYKVRAPPGTVNPNIWYELWTIFNGLTDTPLIYVNNQLYDLPSTVFDHWNDRHSHFFIGNFDNGSAGRPWRGRIDDFRLYRNGTVTQTNVTAMWDNKESIESFPTSGNVKIAIAGFVYLEDEIQNEVFTTADVKFDDVPLAPPAPLPPPPGTDDAPPPPISHVYIDPNMWDCDFTS